MVDIDLIRWVINEAINEKLGLRNGTMTNIIIADGTITQIEMVIGWGNSICCT